MGDSKYIQSLIDQGEGLNLDFKYNISDSKKIAKTLIAFVNTNGGKLLIGVKDNGSIAGIISEEEIFMLEAAAEMYSKPKISIILREWNIESKTILEVTVDESPTKPHYALNEKDKWLAYIRFNANNILANRIMLKVWKRKRRKKGTYILYSREEKLLLNYLESNEAIYLTQFCKIAGIPKFKAENILVNLISLEIIKVNVSEESFSYSLL